MGRILIEISGNTVSAIWAEDADLDVLLVHHDVVGADKEELECYAALNELADDWKPQLTQIY